jgi:hypothetical protein
MPNLSATETLKRPTRGRTIHVYLLQHEEKTLLTQFMRAAFGT